MNPESTASPSAIAARAPRVSPLRRPVLRAFGAMKRGRLHLGLPDGSAVEYGQSAAETFLPLSNPAIRIPAAAAIQVRHEAFFSKCALYGDIGFAESYIDGDWESPDLTAVISWFILNLDSAPTLSGSRRVRSLALNLLRSINRLGHRGRSNSRAMARRNIGEHYDLSNEFFGLFLDPSMMYSAAKWSRPGISLEEAQAEKNESLCRKLRLRSSDHVLEIGSGWGGWALHAAGRHGCRVTTVTLSRQQLEYTRERVARAGLAGRVQVELRDYRDITGVFDKVVSIEMMEAIGHRYLPRFCEAAARALKPDGLMALQFITCPDDRYDAFRRGVDFIQKHIFPGSLLLSPNRVNQQLSRAGGLILHQAEDMGHDYAQTLRCWREQFHHRLESVRALGFDERFIRKWTYYLRYCEAAFALRNISVVQTVHTRANNLAL